MPDKIIASYRIVTPMFIGDANQEANGISPNSVKGALRFWWRALNWGSCLAANNQNEVQALRELHQREKTLFGGVAEMVNGEQTGGQGQFLLRIEDNTKKLSATEMDNAYPLNQAWQTYLLGLGLIKYENHANYYQRSAIVSGSFSVKIYCKNSKYRQELENLLQLWGLLGGLGSRQRKGFGSISITQLTVNGEDIVLAQNRQAVIEKIGQLIDKSAEHEPPYTAISQSSKILCSPSNRHNPWQKLGNIAEKMQMFRGWGFSSKGGKHLINKQPANPTSYHAKSADHDVIYNYIDRAVSPKKAPKSYTFGLPRSYVLSTTPRSEFELKVFARNNNGEEDLINKRSRRASPVFIHVHQFPNDDSMLIQSFLPATFLPLHDSIKLKQKRGGSWDIAVSSTPDWQVIDEYLQIFSTWQAV